MTKSKLDNRCQLLLVAAFYACILGSHTGISETTCEDYNNSYKDCLSQALNSPRNTAPNSVCFNRCSIYGVPHANQIDIEVEATETVYPGVSPHYVNCYRACMKSEADRLCRPFYILYEQCKAGIVNPPTPTPTPRVGCDRQVPYCEISIGPGGCSVANNNGCGSCDPSKNFPGSAQSFCDYMRDYYKDKTPNGALNYNACSRCVEPPTSTSVPSTTTTTMVYPTSTVPPTTTTSLQLPTTTTAAPTTTSTLPMPTQPPTVDVLPVPTANP